METEQYLCDLTKQMFYRYLIEPTEENYSKIVSSWAEPFSLIGTGKHEIYGCAETAIQSMAENQREATSIRFEILDEWYEARMIRADIGIVFGGVWVRERRRTLPMRWWRWIPGSASSMSGRPQGSGKWCISTTPCPISTRVRGITTPRSSSPR